MAVADGYPRLHLLTPAKMADIMTVLRGLWKCCLSNVKPFDVVGGRYQMMIQTQVKMEVNAERSQFIEDGVIRWVDDVTVLCVLHAPASPEVGATVCDVITDEIARLVHQVRNGQFVLVKPVEEVIWKSKN